MQLYLFASSCTVFCSFVYIHFRMDVQLIDVWIWSSFFKDVKLLSKHTAKKKKKGEGEAAIIEGETGILKEFLCFSFLTTHPPLVHTHLKSTNSPSLRVSLCQLWQMPKLSNDAAIVSPWQQAFWPEWQYFHIVNWKMSQITVGAPGVFLQRKYLFLFLSQFFLY